MIDLLFEYVDDITYVFIILGLLCMCIPTIVTLKKNLNFALSKIEVFEEQLRILKNIRCKKDSCPSRKIFDDINKGEE